MTINLEPEDEKLIQKRLLTGVFGSPQEVIHRALESLDAEESWLQENREKKPGTDETVPLRLHL